MELTDRREIIFAPGEETFGLRIFREEWHREPGGPAVVYWKYGLPDGVQVLGLTTDGKVIAIEEDRPGVGHGYPHLIGETMEPGEVGAGGALIAARRGLHEETGYAAESLDYLSAILENSAKSRCAVYFVLARGCRKIGEPEAGIAVRLFSPGEFWRLTLDYFASCETSPHGGGNTLKLMVLAYHRLGLIHLKEVM